MSEQNHCIYEFGPFRLDAQKRLLWRGGEVVPLKPKAFETLLALVEGCGRVLEKDELMRRVWPDTAVEEGNLTFNISTLRKALGDDPRRHEYIVTIPGEGYRFVAGVRATFDELEVRESTSVTVEEEQAGAIADLNGERSALTSAPGESSLLGWSDEQPALNPRPATRDPRSYRRGVALAAAALFVACAAAAAVYFFRSREATNAVGVSTLAVLPFKPLVTEGRDEALEVGVADTLITKLGSISAITVRPLSAVRRYGGLEQDPLAAGRELGVEAVLDGTVWRSGDRVRVTTRLVRIGDGRQLWEGRFEAPFTDIFSVEDAISEKVAGSLNPRLTSAEGRRLAKHYTGNVEAYQLYLRGRYHFFKSTQPEIRKAIGFYRQAIEADPTYALAYAGLADAYRVLPVVGVVPSTEGFPQAKATARRALEIDDELAEAHIVLGWIEFSFDWDWAAAEREIKKAIELSPNNSDAHRAYAHLLSNLGRHEEAVAEAGRARELDPLSLITASLEAQFLFYAGRDDEAIARIEKTLEIEPNYWVAHNILGRVFTRQGRYDEAIAEFGKAKELSGGSAEPITQLGYALAKAGRREQARATLEELRSLSANNYVPAYSYAMIHNGLGEKEEALDYLEKSLQGREVQLTFIKIDARWDGLRADPRFQEVLRRVGLTP